jgi:hypothetical protein
MLKRPSKAKRASIEASLQDAILDDGLALAMEWGKEWLEPIQARLRQKYPQLSDSELDEYDSVCRGAMKFGNATVYALAEETGKNPKYDDFAVRFGSRYPWASPSNLSHLFSQGMYYLWKDGGVE